MGVFAHQNYGESLKIILNLYSQLYTFAAGFRLTCWGDSLRNANYFSPICFRLKKKGEEFSCGGNHWIRSYSGKSISRKDEILSVAETWIGTSVEVVEGWEAATFW
ncbi:hypothetical protein CEXT_310451 [Caerostris extrusa]|uniref:Uncharacterized protein n=1 Tax=Caerostris extrusa TaxID=172846 RepID=A0AAV4UZE8_CAEEX|nr:hypothetical protein CEXT_310451 [Caerostris extrusa]